MTDRERCPTLQLLHLSDYSSFVMARLIDQWVTNAFEVQG
jgi:hypothetical protein